MAKRRERSEEADPDLPSWARRVCTLRGHTDFIGRIAWSPDSPVLASPSADGTVRLWDAASGATLDILKGYTRTVYSVAFDSNGRTIASTGDDRTIRLWNANLGISSDKFRGHLGRVYDVEFDPTGRMVASAGGDNTVRLWDLADRTGLHKAMEGHSSLVTSISFDPSGRTLASASDDGTIRLWDAADGVALRILKWDSDPVYGVAFDPSGYTLASASLDGKIRLWDAASGVAIRTLEGHRGAALSVTFSSDGQVIASNGGDGFVRLWRTTDGSRLGLLAAPVDDIWLPSVAFHPTLPLLAAVSSDAGLQPAERSRLIEIWEIDFQTLLEQAVEPTVFYTSAKVVLVGESNAGKSYLAHRIVNEEAPAVGEITSTHGMTFWPLPPEKLSPTAAAPEGERRDVVLWDMGGQDEYRLVHQLFLHDTTLALVLLDPTRGQAAFDEVRRWDAYLDKQLRGKGAVKLLVGTKLDEPPEGLDRTAIDRLCEERGFADFYETSAITGRGVEALGEAVAEALDWDRLGKTSRPEIFQQIYDEIERRRAKGEVILYESDLLSALFDGEPSEEEKDDVAHVVGQLARQGVIARSEVETGEPVLVLQVPEIERYAGSLILAARDNPRGVPVLELGAIMTPGFGFPKIKAKDRLDRAQERPVLESTVALMLKHGLCFAHEDLLVFPTLFSEAPVGPEHEGAVGASLHYDFSGAIDNIYASLVARLVLAEAFGPVRLWADRAEFEVLDGGLCGLRKERLPSGFAHVDVYFEAETPEARRDEFIAFVEDHLRKEGVTVQERLVVDCPRGFVFDQETLRIRMTEGHLNVPCPRCDGEKHPLTGGATEARKRRPTLVRDTFALKTEIAKRGEEKAERAIRVMERGANAAGTDEPIRILHLSDLHFTKDTPITARLQWLLNDLRGDDLRLDRVDYLVVSGDFTDKGSPEGFKQASAFLSSLRDDLGLSGARCVFVPGNHDVADLQSAYQWRPSAQGLEAGAWVKQGDIVLARDDAAYPRRFKPFSELFYHPFYAVEEYPTAVAEQGMSTSFWDDGIQFLTFNSAWQIDQFHRGRSGIHALAIANATREAQEQEALARSRGLLAADAPVLRIGVWHHAVAGPEMMTDTDFLGHLQGSGVRVGLHGDVHELRRDLVGYQPKEQLYVVGSGSFCAPSAARPESTPRHYNLLEVRRDLSGARVQTRQQRRPDSAWEGWYVWDDPDGGKGKVSFYDIAW